MASNQPDAQQVLQAILTGVYATSMATVRAVQESQSVAFGDNPDGSRDITLAGGLAATAAQAAQAARDLTQAYATLKGLPADPPPA
jgi:hypothetical protein